MEKSYKYGKFFGDNTLYTKKEILHGLIMTFITIEVLYHAGKLIIYWLGMEKSL